ncbi:latrophilin-like protein 1 isoform X2 [Folsomia candida]|uniref:latrophilin-like protein 1 isoform X2 n=1 Tax=Folsomia candida TaxID=158441 RepID=UPI001604DAAC|nr:latrophilin-like protein 1 isoform X2 [Folsomia candida]
MCPSASQSGSFILVLVFILGALVPLEYAEGKQTAYACEGSALRLDCEPGKVIHLIRAIYGRFSITICNENGNTEWSVNCGSPKSILVLNGTCNYQRSCSVIASTKTFGDPCPGTRKYLEVQYQCIPASSLTSTTPKSAVPTNNPLAPWLNPVLSTESKSIGSISGSGGSSSTSVKDLANKPDESGSELIPFGTHQVLGNQSVYGVGTGILSHGDFEHPSVLHTTPTTVPPSSTSISAVLPNNEGDPFSPFNNGGGSRDNDDMGEPSSSGEDDPPLDTEFKRWPGGEGSDTGGSSSVDGTESWWSSQFERPKETDGDNSWSDKVSGGGGEPPSRSNTNNNGKSGLGVPKGVVTLSPTVQPPYGAHQEVESELEDDMDSQNKRISLSGGRENGKDLCASRMDRGMFWNWTMVGETAKQACPGGASGLARWKCVENHRNNNLPRVMWFPESPDLSDCKSAWLLSLQARVLEGDRISNVAGDLAQVTSTKPMYGGDIAAAVRIIKTIATRMNDQLRTLTNQVSREDLAAELLQLILEAGSNLLEKARLDGWRDLSYADQMKIATDLLVGLEDNAFLLANVVTSEKILRKSVKNILTSIYAIEANNVREINFPAEGSDHWGRMGDSLTMPAEALRENSDGGLVRLVCFAYNNLEHVLQPVDNIIGSEESTQVRKLVNSRVISASLNQGRHIQLALPVRLTLRHLWLDNVSNPQCVFWDYTQDKWSEEGCHVENTNRTHTVCQCGHLTNFAILMDLQPPPKQLPTPQMLQVVMYIGSAVVVLCLFFTLIITHFCINGRVFQTMILKNLFVCILIGEIIFVSGIHLTHKPVECTVIAMLLHYFALASVLWLFLHGFHLHLIVVEAAENGLSRQLWYYGVSYGSPAIVVLLSFLLDPRSYRSEKHCWVQTSFTLLCFVGPAVLVALATAAVLIYTSYKVCGLLSAMPKKPNDDKSLYTYAGTWLRGSFLILIFMILAWTLRLLDLESSSPSLSYAASLMLALEGIAILVFHALKSEDMITKICDCAKSSDSSDTEMSTHSQQQLQGGPGGVNSSGAGSGGSSSGYMLEACQNNHLTQRVIDGNGRILTLSRQPVNHHDAIYSKQLGGVGLQQSPGGGPMHRYPGDPSAILGLYSKGPHVGLEGSWRGSSYSDIRSGFHRADPVYEEIEKPNHLSPRASVSDLSEDEGQGHLYPHDVDIYHRNIYGQQPRGPPLHHHHHVHNTNKSRKLDVLQGGEAANPLLASIANRSQHQQQLQQSQPHYTTRHRTPSDHHHVSLKGIHPDEHILQNVHMV